MPTGFLGPSDERGESFEMRGPALYGFGKPWDALSLSQGLQHDQVVTAVLFRECNPDQIFAKDLDFVPCRARDIQRMIPGAL